MASRESDDERDSKQGRSGLLPAGIGFTAVGIAAARAAETRRPDHLFEDPFAEHFVAAARQEQSWPSAEPSRHAVDMWALMSDYFAIRTRFFDDYLVEACKSGSGQVVILGAGLDTRAFRLPLPEDVRLFELDTPEVFAFKEAVLRADAATPVCKRAVVPIDLRRD